MALMGGVPSDGMDPVNIRASKTKIASNQEYGLLTENIMLAHAMIHRGDHYSFYYLDADLDTTETFTINIKTPASKSTHMSFFVRPAGAGTMSFCEAVTTSASAVGVTASSYNSNRGSTNSAATVIMTGSDIVLSSSGVTLMSEYLGANTSPAIESGVGSSREDEWVLKTGSTYSIRFTTDADNNKVQAGLLWYETPVC